LPSPVTSGMERTSVPSESPATAPSSRGVGSSGRRRRRRCDRVPARPSRRSHGRSVGGRGRRRGPAVVAVAVGDEGDGAQRVVRSGRRHAWRSSMRGRVRAARDHVDSAGVGARRRRSTRRRPWRHRGGRRVQVAAARDRGAVQVAGGPPVDAERRRAAACGVDVRARGSAVDDVGGAGVRPPARVGLGRADDEVGVAVAVDVAGRGGRAAEAVARRAAVDPEAAELGRRAGRSRRSSRARRSRTPSRSPCGRSSPPAPPPRWSPAGRRR